MRFEPLGIHGAWIIEPEPIRDARGGFARIFCAETFAKRGLCSRFDQVSWSQNLRAGTLRGLHLQRPPHGEAKLIRATAGAVFDVAADLRPNSPTYGQWAGVELSSANLRLVYLPEGVAHGFQSLVDDAELTYQISVRYTPEAQDGVAWNDPDLAVRWPDPKGAILSERDQGLCSLREFRPLLD